MIIKQMITDITQDTPLMSMLIVFIAVVVLALIVAGIQLIWEKDDE